MSWNAVSPLDQKNPETSKVHEAATVKSMACIKFDDFTSTGDHSSADEDEEIEVKLSNFQFYSMISNVVC